MAGITAKDESALFRAMKIKPSSIEAVTATEEFEAVSFRVDIIYQDNDIILQIYPIEGKMAQVSEFLPYAFSKLKRVKMEKIEELSAWWVRLMGYAGNPLTEEAMQEALNDLDQTCSEER